MANFDRVKQDISASVYENTGQEITGGNLQNVLLNFASTSELAQSESVARDNAIQAVDARQNERLTNIEAKDVEQDTKLDGIATDLTDIKHKDSEQDTEIALKLNITDAVGKKTAEGGEIFNNYTENEAGAASHAEGHQTKATGSASHSEGWKTEATAGQAHAEGIRTKASALGSHAEGGITIASAPQSHAEGAYSIASGVASHAEGAAQQNIYLKGGVGVTKYEIVAGLYLSEFKDNKETALLRLNDPNAIVQVNDGSGSSKVVSAQEEGGKLFITLKNTITSEKAIDNTTGKCLSSIYYGASGSGSHVEGNGNTSMGIASHAEGVNTVASDEASHAEGTFAIATGIASHAEGDHTIASGRASHAEGLGTKATKDNEHAQGKYNATHENTIDSVGVGTGVSDRKNATETLNDGKHYILGVGTYDGTNPGADNDVASVVKDIVGKDIVQDMDIKSLGCGLDNAGHHKALSYSAENEICICGYPLVVRGNGAPSTENMSDERMKPLGGAPAFVGQLYIDTSVNNGGLYYAVGVGSVADWKNA